MYSILNSNYICFMAVISGMGIVIISDSVNLYLAGSASDNAKLLGFPPSVSAGGR